MWKWCCLLLLLPSYLLLAEPLRAVVSQTNTAPYAIFDQQQRLTGGIAKELLDTLAARLGRQVQYLDLPRGRVIEWLVTDKADISCFLSPEWVPASYKLSWTPVLFYTRQYIVRRAEDSPLRSNKDLVHKRIGTTRGFSYPELQPLFTNNAAVRDDAESIEKNIQRLEQGRVDLVMTVDLSYGQYQKHNDTSKLAADPLWAEPAAVYCALNSTNQALVLQIQQQFEVMQQQGLIKKAVQRYEHSSL